MNSLDTLSKYYNKHYPYKEVWKFIDGNKKKEIAYQGKSKKGENYFSRHNKYQNAVEFKEEAGKYGRTRIEIGPEYDSNGQAIKKELVFDIDLTDYDDVRTCCKGTNVCDLCWNYVRAAMKMMHFVLSTQFGFKKIHWFFSGRRGVHCWVLDEEAKSYSTELRVSILEFIKCPAADSLSPQQKECVNILMRYFVELILPALEDQGKEWRESTTPNKKLSIVLTHTWPRLDEAVTTSLVHLIKSPFSVHPDTGKISIPIPFDEIDTFSPVMSPPTVLQVLSSNRKMEFIF